MSKDNRTLEELQNNLDRDLSWRRKELVIIKNKIPPSKGSTTTPEQAAMLRSGVTMLYAHWEGFFKASATHYLQFVALKDLKYGELSPCFVALAMRVELQDLGANKPEKWVNAVNYFLANISQRAKLPYKNIVNTKSNLTAAVLKEICSIIGLNYSKYELKEKLIDTILVKNRNHIAHGNYLEMDYTSFIELYEEITKLLDDIRNDLLECATKGMYKDGTLGKMAQVS